MLAISAALLAARTIVVSVRAVYACRAKRGSHRRARDACAAGEAGVGRVRGTPAQCAQVTSPRGRNWPFHRIRDAREAPLAQPELVEQRALLEVELVVVDPCGDKLDVARDRKGDDRCLVGDGAVSLRPKGCCVGRVVALGGKSRGDLRVEVVIAALSDG